jgi:flagellar biosynthesis anti-sigma factor FlgM
MARDNMRIPGNNGPDRPASADRVRSASSKKAGESSTSSNAATVSGGVTATVSARARTLAAEHGMDVDKVERLREAIQSGGFQMDFQLIAKRIVEEGA